MDTIMRYVLIKLKREPSRVAHIVPSAQKIDWAGKMLHDCRSSDIAQSTGVLRVGVVIKCCLWADGEPTCIHFGLL